MNFFRFLGVYRKAIKEFTLTQSAQIKGHKKVKRKTLFLSLLILSSFLLLSLIFWFSCGFFFRRNPNLRLFLKSERSAFNPVVSPDGNKVYYLYGDGPQWATNLKRELRVINSDGSGDRVILEGDFFSLAISPDGRKLALTTGNFWEGGVLLITDTSGSKVDTIPVGDSIMDVEFGSTAGVIYYFRNQQKDFVWKSGIYKWECRDSTEKLILEEGEFRFVGGFDINGDSLLFVGGKLYSLLHDTSFFLGSFEYISWPQFSPKIPHIVAGVYMGEKFDRSSGYNDIQLINTDPFSRQPLNVRPYRSCLVTQPYWFPSGNKIIFSAAECNPDGGAVRGDFELWILELE